MRLVLACVLGWFAAAAALASHDSGTSPSSKGRQDRSGSLIVTLGAHQAR
jgi:hypothetical protein